MDPNSMKNMIILKNLPSNLVEEAFIVFKDNVKIHKIEKVENSKKNGKSEKPKPKEYIVKEAEIIVNDYISKIENKECLFGKGKIDMQEKYKRLKSLTLFLAIFSALSLVVILFK